MNSQEQMGVYKELEQKGWINFIGAYRASESGVYGKMYQLLNSYDAATNKYKLENTPEAINNYLRQAEYRNTTGLICYSVIILCKTIQLVFLLELKNRSFILR